MNEYVPLNVGDAMESMAQCLARANMACLFLSTADRIPELADTVSDEILERARLEEPGLSEMTGEFLTLTMTDIPDYVKPTNVDELLQDWHIYLDQVVQYCAANEAWEAEGLISPDNMISRFIHVWWHPIQELRGGVAALIRYRNQVPKMYPMGKVGVNGRQH